MVVVCIPESSFRKFGEDFAFTSAVNALIDMGEKAAARELYDIAFGNGLPKNAYIEKRLC